MFRSQCRRSGSLRSVWHRRERKRRPVELHPNAAAVVATPRINRRASPSESQWLDGYPPAMLACVARLATDPRLCFDLSPAAVVRKLRLFYCACCRLRWADLPTETLRRAVGVIEQFADGNADRQEWAKARDSSALAARAARGAMWRSGYAQPQTDAADLAALVMRATEAHHALQRGTIAAGFPIPAADQAALLRELFRNPFHPAALEPAWLTDTVLSLARQIYRERAFDLMPILGDALQDAGCDDEGILGHCYGPGPHVLGCWLGDLLSGWGAV